MNEFIGTPGPWILHQAAAKNFTETLTGANHYDAEYFAVLGANGEVVCDNAQYYPQAVTRADAILISAAPDLLKAVSAFLLYVDSEGGDTQSMLQFADALDKARIAYAKALGEQQ